MSVAERLSPAQQRRRQQILARDARDAAARLRNRADWMLKRAARARAGSNERRKLAARAEHLQACAKLIEAEAGCARDLDSPVLRRGWRTLTQQITIYAAKVREAHEKAQQIRDREKAA